MNDGSVDLAHRPTRSPIATRQRATAKQIRRPWAMPAVAFVLYLGFACYLTWPLVTNLAHNLYGSPGDPYGIMAFFRELVDHRYNPFLPGTITQFSGPEGQAIPWARDLASAPGVLALYLLTAIFGAIPAFGIYTLAGYAVTGTAMFLFARWLTANTWAALIAGWAFAFYPFAALNGQSHPDNVQGWLFVLAVWRMLELLWHPSRRAGVLAGLAVVLVMWWSPYFILFGGVMYVLVTATALLRAWRRGRLRQMLAPQLTAAVFVAVFLACLGALSTVGIAEGAGVRVHKTAELVRYAARPLEYLVPDSLSPVFGGATRGYVEAHMYGSNPTEATLYVGITVILLAVVALAALVRRKLAPRLRLAVIVLLLITVAGVVCSMPPEVAIFGVQVPFPSQFVARITTTWRVYSRFVIIVMFGLSVLAAIGLDALTRGRALRVTIGVMAVATVAVPIDLWAHQNKAVTTISTPGIYRILARQPKGLVAEYPLAASGYNDYGDQFFQAAYGMPTIDGYLSESFEELRALSLANLARPSTASRLATLGVRYVIVDAHPAQWAGWPPAHNPGSGFRLIAREPYAALYAVTAHPKGLVIPTAGEGFSGRQLTRVGVVAWLEAASGSIELTGKCLRCDGVLSMKVESFAQPHHVTISDDRGRVLVRYRVAGSAMLKIPLEFSRRTTLRVAARPGPQPAYSSPERSWVSIRVSELEFTEAAQTHGRPAR